jgi:hypothetical protein
MGWPGPFYPSDLPSALLGTDSVYGGFREKPAREKRSARACSFEGQEPVPGHRTHFLALSLFLSLLFAKPPVIRADSSGLVRGMYLANSVLPTIGFLRFRPDSSETIQATASPHVRTRSKVKIGD